VICVTDSLKRGDEEFDLQIGLDRRFHTSPNGNPGNAIQSYNSAGIVEASDFDIDAFDAGTGQGQNLCLQSISVAAGTSFLAAVHGALINHLPLRIGISKHVIAAGAVACNERSV
jgi:hypothetical protein